MTSTPSTALPVLRIGLFLFMMVWSVEKIIRPEAYQGIYGFFYGLEVGVGAVYAAGAVQLVILAAFVLGLFKTYSYGLVLLMNLATLLVSYRQILAPYDGEVNHLFAASVPVLAGCVVLFMLRDHDTKLVVNLGRSPQRAAA